MNTTSEEMIAKESTSLIEAYELGLRVLEEAESVTVSNTETAETAKEVSVKLSKIEKALEERRTEIVKPFGDKVKAVNNLAKKLTAPFANAKNTISRKIITWQNEVRRKQDEERKAREKEAADALLARAPVQPVAPPVPKPQEKVISTRIVKSFTLEDISKVPKQYLKTIVDEAKVKEAIQAGITAIPGIQIIENEVPIFR